MGIFIPKKLSESLKGMDLSTEESFYAGISSFVISLIVTLVTFYKLLEHRTQIVVAIVVSIVVFYVFTAFYSFVILLGLKVFKRNEEKL